MWAAIPFHVVHDSAKRSTIPVMTKMRTASQRNPGPLPVESADHFPWNHRTTSTGIRIRNGKDLPIHEFQPPQTWRSGSDGAMPHWGQGEFFRNLSIAAMKDFESITAPRRYAGQQS
jgi:hypothetical protein